MAEALATSRVRFDPFDPGLIASPYDAYDQLRRQDPLHWSVPINAWVATRMDDVRAILTDSRFAASNTAALVADLSRRIGHDYSPLLRFLSASLFFRNGEDHQRSRRIVTRIMNRTPLSRLETVVRSIAAKLAGPLQGAEGFDVVPVFAEPLPQLVMAHILSLPAADVPALNELLSDMALVFDTATVPTYDRVNARVARCLDILAARIDADKDDRDSALTLMYEGAPGGGEEKLANAAAMVLFTFRVGAETTIGLLGLIIRTLVDRPDLRTALQADRSLVSRVVTEILRLESNVQRSVQIATEPVVVRGKTLNAGARVVVMLGAANRDPEAFASAGDITTEGAVRDHIAFGAGPHFCPGASLAQLEGRVCLETFLDLPLERAGVEQWFTGRTIRRLTALPLRRAKSA